MMDNRPTVPCRHCSDPTPMLGTKMCDRCWELEWRVKDKPAVAAKILGVERWEAYIRKCLEYRDYKNGPQCLIYVLNDKRVELSAMLAEIDLPSGEK